MGDTEVQVDPYGCHRCLSYEWRPMILTEHDEDELFRRAHASTEEQKLGWWRGDWPFNFKITEDEWGDTRLEAEAFLQDMLRQTPPTGYRVFPAAVPQERLLVWMVWDVMECYNDINLKEAQAKNFAKVTMLNMTSCDVYDLGEPQVIGLFVKRQEIETPLSDLSDQFPF